MTQQEALRLFSEVHRLHRLGRSNGSIAELLSLRRATGVKWLKASQYGDQLGWKQGLPREHPEPVVAKRICQIKKDRLQHKYLFGREYVQMD